MVALIRTRRSHFSLGRIKFSFLHRFSRLIRLLAHFLNGKLYISHRLLAFSTHLSNLMSHSFFCPQKGAMPCQNATRISTQVVSGSTISESPMGSICAEIASLTPTSWYYFNGTGEMIWASTCLRDTNFESVIAIYNVTDGSPVCGNQQCLVSGTRYNTEQCATISFFTEIGKTYYIGVAGSQYNTVGTFGLSIATSAEQLLTCADNSTTLATADSSSYSGSTVPYADKFIPSYPSLDSQLRGKWFKLVRSHVLCSPLRRDLCSQIFSSLIYSFL
jgi:hypothetical protein